MKPLQYYKDHKISMLKAEIDKKELRQKAYVANCTKKEKQQFNMFHGYHTNFVNYVKNNLNDKKSFKHIKTFYYDMENYLIVKMTFSGNNAFGARVVNTLTAKVDCKGNILKVEQ